MELQVSVMENVDPHFKETTKAMKGIWKQLGLGVGRDGSSSVPTVWHAQLLESAAPPNHPSRDLRGEASGTHSWHPRSWPVFPGDMYSQVGLPRPEPLVPSSGECLAADSGGGGNGGGGGVIRSGTWGWTDPDRPSQEAQWNLTWAVGCQQSWWGSEGHRAD